MKNLFVLLFVSIWKLAPSNAKEIGSVFQVKGSAQRIADGKEFQLRNAMTISEGDIIQTAADSKVRLAMKDRNIIVITENSRMKIELYSTEAENKKVKINLDYGSLRNKVEQKYVNKGELYEVTTPISVAGVRGTDFITAFNKESGESVLCTIEGKVKYDLIINGKIENNSLIVAKGDFIRHSLPSEPTLGARSPSLPGAGAEASKRAASPVPQIVPTEKKWLENALKRHSLED